MVKAVSPQGSQLSARALLDQGSELSFVCEALAQSLRLRRRSSHIPLTGIGAKKSISTRGIVRLTLQPHFSSSDSFEVDAHVIPQITRPIPTSPIQHPHWRHIKNLTLADPSFATPGPVDILLGADLYGYLLRNDVLKGQDDEPVAQHTSLGWIISGPSMAKIQSSATSPFIGQCIADQQLNDVVNRFWTQESVSPPVGGHLSEDDKHCEKHFSTTSFRDSSGRYTVRLPFKSVVKLGASRSGAVKMLENLHRKFRQSPNFRKLYIDFLAEYKSLDHMQQVDSNDHDVGDCYYLPHHGVLRESSTTTKLRVVFNGAHKTSEGLSLNDVLHSGPKVQQDLDAVLLRWRIFPYVFTSDIEKMYRQILIHPEDRKYQRILWSEYPNQTPSTFELTTVTYGLTCAPFLAIRTLLQLATDEGKRFPLGAETIRKNMYVDDVLSGADTVELAQERACQVNKILLAGGFKLQKWASNDPAILSTLTENQNLLASKALGDESYLRALGLSWDPTRDSFIFLFCAESVSSSTPRHFTKRSVLSVIARLFDPLGWLAPVVILAKIFLQTLWTASLNWDEPLPPELANQWESICHEFRAGVTFTIPRWLGTYQASIVELHGFSDASRSALSAVVYVRVAEEESGARVTLLTAKTKVAPVKPVTIPRLELSAAVLLAQLIVRVREVLNFKGVPAHLWVDSSVALAWIRGHPSRWKDFVSNRVALIQELVPNCRWNHIAGGENPADVASRGIFPSELVTTRSWWHGPEWLAGPPTTWPSSDPRLPDDANLEERARPVLTTVSSSPIIWNLIEKYSSLERLLRITARVLFAASRFRHRVAPKPTLEPVTPSQLNEARLFWIKQTQTAYFKSEITLLKRGSSLPTSSPLLRLSPFLDENGLMRLGGRLQNALMDEDRKHPFILPRKSTLTHLLIIQAHLRTLHGGTQLTLSTLRQQVWIVGGRAPVRSTILSCVTCTRQRGTALQQKMGQLPAFRIQPSRPFLHSGVDYAGPFILKLRRDRSAVTYKGYLVVFVCMTTSAVHLELATDYSTDGFIAAYKRFTGRRGICATLISDCGTNLVGADKELKRLFRASSKEFAELRSLLAKDNTTWRFNPPAAPHFGGKWEAAVKSAKFHLRRVIGDARLTYEEFSSLLVQIECVLNSRPLCTITDDPDDFAVLTPGHFLIGEPLNTLPEPNLSLVPTSRLSQWQRTRQMLEHFWQKWSREYLQRQLLVSKWQRPHQQLQVGSIVLVIDDRYPPSKWPLARVIEVHPGPDKLVRVATLKMAGGTTLRRPVTKLCLLPAAESMANLNEGLNDRSPPSAVSTPPCASVVNTPVS